MADLGVDGRRAAPAPGSTPSVLGLPVTGPDSPDPVDAGPGSPPTGCATGAPADPLTPLYLRRPDAVEPGRPKAVTPA